MRKVKNEEELADAIKKEEDEIEIEGDLAKGIIKIKAKGKVAWMIASASLIFAIAILLRKKEKSKAEFAIAAASATSSIAILGYTTTITSISLAIAAKDFHILNKIREEYELQIVDNNKVFLIKK